MQHYQLIRKIINFVINSLVLVKISDFILNFYKICIKYYKTIIILNIMRRIREIFIKNIIYEFGQILFD